MHKRLALIVVALAFVTAACGDDDPGDGNADVTSIGDDMSLQTFTFDDGLDCVALDTYKGAGVDCDWEHFTPPSTWANRTGKIDRVDLANDISVALFRYDNGTVCAAADGYESGGISCHTYPASTGRR